MSTNDDLLAEYLLPLEKLLPLARRAYGSKDQNTPNHVASREYTRLLCEYHSRGGSLPAMAKELGVAYSGIRRRVHTADVPVTRRKRLPKGSISVDMIHEAADRVRGARNHGTPEYHRQLHEEFAAGIPMNMLARELGISNAAPLYYGIQSHEKRISELA